MNILITGGASGLGEAITRELAGQESLHTFFTYHSSAVNAAKLETEFKNATGIKCDFKNEQELEALAAKIEELEIDVLINNAYNGSFINSYFHKTQPAVFLTEFANNIIPTIKLSQAAITFFRKKKKGKLISILTAALVNTPPIGSAIYVANKAYLEELTKLWATENARFNITSNSVSPAFMETGFTDKMDERLIEQMREGHPLKSLLNPKEVAQTVLYLVNAGTQLNGVNILINSAQTIR